MLQVRLTGAAEARAAAEKLRAGTKDARAEYVAAVRRELLPVQREVRVGIPRYLPSGYAPTLAKSMRLSTASAGGTVEVRGRARGRKGHDRDIGRMDRGVLRAPSWPRGRRATWKWHAQAIPRGFFTDPIRNRRNEIRAAIVRAMQRVARRSA